MVTAAQQTLINAQFAPGRIGQEISTAVARKTLDAAKIEGAAVMKLLDGAARIAAGDPLVAKATGLGTLLDVTV